MAEFQRPNIPYAPQEVLPNNNRYALEAAAGQPPTAADFDGEFNWVADSMNDLYDEMQGIAAGILPGADQAVNVNKFPVTNGENPATISWTQVLTQYIANLAVTTAKIADGAITTAKLGPAVIDATKIYPGSILTDGIAANAVTTSKIADGAVTAAKIAPNAVNTENIMALAITAAQIANNTITAQQIANNTITNQQLALVAQTPIGAVIDWAGTTGQAPPGWVQANGQAIDRVQYAALFTVIGVTYGAGDGATTFNVPDLRGRATFGIDVNPNQQSPTGGRITTATASALTSGGNGGEQTHTLTTPEIPSHSHTYTPNPQNQYTNITGGANPSAPYQGNAAATGSAGGDQPHNNMSPFMLITKIIYAGV